MVLCPNPNALTDLESIDNLLVLMKGPSQTWADVEQQYSITRIAVARLRQAWADDEVRKLTASLAAYLSATESES